MQTVAKICVFLRLLGICHTNVLFLGLVFAQKMKGCRLNGQADETMILPFVCNSTNASSITIHFRDGFNYIIYDVAQKRCNNVSNYYMNRIESCVLNGKNFNLTIGQLKWFDKGNYTAWDDQGFFLDSIFVDVLDSNKFIQHVTYGPDHSNPKEGDDNNKSTQQVTDSPDSSSHMDGNDNNKSTQQVTYSPDSSSHMDGNDYRVKMRKKTASVWLLGASILLLLMVACLAIVVVWKYRP